jgi:hypothetical protein
VTKNIVMLIIESDKSERESLRKNLASFKESAAFIETPDIESGYQQVQNMDSL